MKLLTKPTLFLAMCTLLVTQTGCFGSFKLTNSLYNWNDGATSNKFVKSLLFLGLCIIPVYEIAVVIDVVIFNLIEFWGGSDPMSMNEGDHEMQLVRHNGIDYRIDATKDTFTTTQLSGELAGAVRVLKFDRKSLTWTYSDSRVCDQPVATILDESTGAMRVYTQEGAQDVHVDMTAMAGVR